MKRLLKNVRMSVLGKTSGVNEHVAQNPISLSLLS